MHAQRTREVICQTALTCYRACYDISRARVACVWRAALPVRDFVVSPGGFRLRGLGCRSSFLVQVLDD